MTVHKTTARPQDYLDFRLGLANIRNNPDLPRSQVRADATGAGKEFDVGLLQEIQDFEDWIDVRSSIPDYYFQTAQVKKEGNVEEHREKRGVTMFANKRLFTIVGETTDLLPGFGKGVRFALTQRRAHKRLAVRAKGKTLPTIVFVNNHLINGAYGSKPGLATPARRVMWQAQFARSAFVARRHLRKGRIVFFGGDFNRIFRDCPKAHPDQKVVISEGIDWCVALLPPGVAMRVLDRDSARGFSDHPRRVALVRLRRLRKAR